ncbi:ABC transporter ATP-binding protein [Halobacterium bonnevillei]|uniref:ATP-binding cassette domain-containing protein n=1 Tax=Halobacterium bonnevillei TaxID=2692200 RepID=A0A6B0SQE7_9EURY|nr:ABC transporter ATP-binding protein [Halobacterium bonnevillei]MXR19859.1 ATP-binding cassette domain-containing protein [Halobacterium bonnevillei]
MTERTLDGHVSISNLEKVYDDGAERTTAIKDLSFDIEGGEFASIVGPSGCGKSTLLYLVAGFLDETSGSIEVDGDPIDGPGTDRGVVFQDYALFPWRTVMENVTYGLEEQGYTKEERRSRAQKYIDMMDLSGFEDNYPKELSGGMKQRVGLARTLAYDPKILLMDEPFGALDQPLRESLQDQLIDIWGDLDKTVVFVTHDVEEAVYLSDTVMVMTRHPGTKKNVTKVDLDRSQTREAIITSNEFTETKNDVWKSLREETQPEVQP